MDTSSLDDNFERLLLNNDKEDEIQLSNTDKRDELLANPEDSKDDDTDDNEVDTNVNDV